MDSPTPSPVSSYRQEVERALTDSKSRAKRLDRLIEEGELVRQTMATPGWILLRKQSRELRKSFQRQAVMLELSDPKVQATQRRIKERELFFMDCAQMVKSAKAAHKELEGLAVKIENFKQSIREWPTK